MMNAKSSNQNIPFEVSALPFDKAAYNNLDNEIRSVLPPNKLIVPDDVRGDFDSLRESVLTQGWPKLASSRGKFIFALDESIEKIQTYKRGKPNLDGLILFPNTHDENDPSAAWFKIDDAKKDKKRIQRLVAAGFLVRTRADIETIESRNNDNSRKNMALESGAQYISSDYFFARPDFSPYEVRLPQGVIARCNPASGGCK